MAINKVIVNGETKLDLTADTVTEDNVVEGFTFHDATGELKTGTFAGAAGDIPFYFYKLDSSNIYDPDQILESGLPATFHINSVEGEDGTLSNYWVYLSSDRDIQYVYNSFEESTSGINISNAYVIALYPITSVNASLENTQGY